LIQTADRHYERVKRFTSHILWFVAGAVLGVISNTVLANLWFQLGWRQPIADWLVSHGFSTMLAAYWGSMYLHLPDWFLVTVVSICGGIFIRRQLIVSLLMFGFGFVVIPFFVTVIAGFDPTVFGLAIFLRTLIWDSITILLVLLFGTLSHQLRMRKNHGA
jgi:hypothetical protein